ncbi:MAG: penicillin-binding protein 2 [Candidatus Moranbacteria bacterium]|nr:penicillin-binding protein 2 [Candidatus Moranbacteria bacterium]
MVKRKRFKPGTEIENPIAFSSIAGQSEELNDQKNIIRSNLAVFWFFLNLILLIIVGRVFYLQALKGSYYQKIAESNRIKNVEIKAPRGLITDRNGEILASNIPSFDVVFVPSEMPDNYQDRKKIYSSLAEECDLDEFSVESIIERTNRKTQKKYLLKDGIDYEKALVLIENLQNLQGVYLEKTAKREYADGEVFSSILGYTGKISEEELKTMKGYSMTDYIGKNGLEYTYEKWLKGQHGRLRMEVDSNGSVKEELGISPPVSGNKLVLNIDSKLQKKSFEVLNKVLEINKNAKGASMVAVDPRNGAVLALVSLPGYDNNLFADGISSEKYSEFLNNPANPMLNRAISGEYPPGSIFKPLLASMGLEEGVINSDTTLNCSGSISVGQWSFRDWKTHGITNLNKAISESCNIYFYAVGGGWSNIAGLGVDRMSKYSKYFGLGNILGIDIPWESSGTIPDAEWKFKEIGEKWYIGDSYHMSIGQGYTLVTPLQIASAIAVIANEGTLYQPEIVSKIINSDGQGRKIEKQVIRSDFISGDNLRKVKGAMRETVTRGSGVSMSDMEVEVAGKTGTAQFGAEEKTHSWFVSFAPFDDPEIATVVLIESGGEGHDWATPATEQILREYFDEEPEEIDWSKIKNRVEARN